jgi:hypothetical protein
VSSDGFGRADVRVGAAYEAERGESRSRLAAASAARRVELGEGLVLVLETRESVRAALEETLRSQRVADPEEVDAEMAVFAALLPGDDELVATLYLDVADPAALADRLGELAGIAAALSMELGQARVTARLSAADAEGGAARVVFPLGAAGAAHLLSGAPVVLALDHPQVRARVTLDEDQLRALASR